MEPSMCQELNECSNEADPLREVCRLRERLNEDCMIKVFEYLNVHDLLEMCKVDNYFKDLITKWVIGKKVINFRVMSKSRKMEIYNTFGKSMRKIISYDAELNNLLLTIIKYCAPGTLTEAEFNWKLANLDSSVIRRSMPFFSNLRKLSLECYFVSSYDEFLAEIAMAATNLEMLYLNNVDVSGDWLRMNRMDKLSELRLHKPRNVSFHDLNIFVSQHTKLEVLKFSGWQDITVLGETLIKYCPNLRTFEDIHISHTQRQFITTVANRYNFLASFSNLTHLTLSSYTFCGSDLHQPLMLLSTKNIVKLKVVSELEHAVAFDADEHARVMKSSFRHCVSLQEVELNVRHFKTAGDLHCDFILHFTSHLKNLKKFTLDCNRLTRVNKILQLIPMFQILCISQVTFQHLPVEIRKIVRTLRVMKQIRDEQKDYQHNFQASQLLHLIVSIEQWRELQVYKDIDSIMTVEIDRRFLHYMR